MPYKRKTWQEKLTDKEGYPKILELKEKFPCYSALHKMGLLPGAKIVLVNPSEVVESMKAVPRGKLTTIIEICKKIAKTHKVDGCCSLTTGIFITTVANAAEEASNSGKNLDIPYWRTLKAEGYLNEKYPGGAEAQKILLESEDHRVNRKGTRLQVVDYESKLISYID